MTQIGTIQRDGRSLHDLRQISIKFPGLARVDGSAFFSFGGSPAGSSASGSTGPTPSTPTATATSAIASLTGPAEVRLASEHPSQLTFDVLLRPFCGIPATESKALAANVRHVLGTSLIWGMNPRTLVQMVVQVLGSNWSAEGKRGGIDTVMATAVNAGMLALMNAGSVPLKGVICAVAVGRRFNDGVLVLDPGGDEEEVLSASGCFAFLFSSLGGEEDVVGRCVWMNWRAVGKARLDERTLGEARQLAKGAAEEVYLAMKKNIEGIWMPSGSGHTLSRKGKGRDISAHADADIQHNDDCADDDDDDQMEI
jgi:exosome complex component RRP46